MIADRLTKLLDWRPDEREKRLLQMLLGVAIAAWLYVAFDARQTAAAEYAAAQQRLAETRMQFKLLSNNRWRVEIAAQKKLLAQSAIVDATPAISRIRLRGEIMALAASAGLTAPAILENYAADDISAGQNGKQRFAALTTTIEFDFDWAGLLRLLEQVEYSGRGYFIDGFEVRQEGDKRRMRVTFRALHQKQAAAI